MHRTRSVLAGSAMTVSLTVLGGALAGCDAPSQPVGGPASSVPTPSASAPASSDTSSAGPGESTSPAETGGSTATDGSETDDVPASPAEPTSVPTFGGSATDAPDASGVPTTYAEALGRVNDLRGGNAQELRRFSTPGDRVYCVLEDPVLGTACELRGGAIDDPEVCGGGVADAVGRIELIGAGAVPQCNTDTIREPGASTVRPAALVGRGGVVCAVEGIGVTCVRDSTEQGFFLAPGRYATFG